MIKGIGVDIVEINRIERAIKKRKELINRLFTPQEQKYCQAQKKAHRHFAARFAAKEAALKALGTGRQGISWTEIEVCRDRSGKPYLHLYGKAADQAKTRGIGEIFISLSFDKGAAVASAIAIGNVGPAR